MNNKSVAIIVTNPDGIYSGGRYFSLMLAESFSSLGFTTHYITDRVPIFSNDLSAFEYHKNIKFRLGLDDCALLGDIKVDYTFVIPGTTNIDFYDNALKCASIMKSKIALVNFESPNWFNKYAKDKKDEKNWDGWLKIASYANLILSISKEGNKYAKGFYKNTHEDIKFDYAYPPINTAIIDHDKIEERKDRILFFANFSQAKHKSSNKLVSLFCPSMSGFEIAVIIGNGQIDETIKSNIEDAARVYDIKLNWLFSISDKQKFALYKSSKLLLFPSEFEGFGYPPVEAIYCGCHVVAFDLPVLKETCHNSIHYVKHGDWNEYKTAVSQVVDNLRNKFIEAKNENVNSIARLDMFSERISKILDECDEKKINYTEGDLKFLWKDKKMSILMKVSKLFLVKLNTFFVSNNRKITYYPRFRSDNDLNNHYFRSLWYLPFKKDVLESVCFNVAYNNSKPECSSSMGDYSNNSDHVKIENGKFKFLFSLFSSKVVLVWDSSASNTPIYKLLAMIGVKLINVDTTDLKSKEYGEYPGIMWRHLLTNKQRRDFNQVQVSKFEQTYKEKSNGRKISTVFGTGPSIDLALNYDFSNSITIVCNSIVQDKELIAHINPDFITAGDAVSHFGVSSYAKKFRDDMIEVLKSNKNIFYFGTVTFGYIFSVHYPDLIDKMIFISQSLDGPNYNLNDKFEAPKLVSTMNIHMLPLAATFSDHIFILGADGKNPDQSKNEDFWQHSNKAQYTNLVDTGHECHPTFDIHRQVSTYDDYNKSIENTISNGEEIGKKYYCLSDSYIPYLSKIKIKNSELISYGLIRGNDRDIK